MRIKILNYYDARLERPIAMRGGYLCGKRIYGDGTVKYGWVRDSLHAGPQQESEPFYVSAPISDWSDFQFGDNLIIHNYPIFWIDHEDDDVAKWKAALINHGAPQPPPSSTSSNKRAPRRRRSFILRESVSAKWLRLSSDTLSDFT